MRFGEVIELTRLELVAAGHSESNIDRVLKTAGETFLLQECLIPEAEVKTKELAEFDLEISTEQRRIIKSSVEICLKTLR